MDYRVDDQVDLGPSPGFTNNKLNDLGHGTSFLSDSVSPSYSGFSNSSTPRSMLKINKNICPPAVLYVNVYGSIIYSSQKAETIYMSIYHPINA